MSIGQLLTLLGLSIVSYFLGFKAGVDEGYTIGAEDMWNALALKMIESWNLDDKDNK